MMGAHYLTARLVSAPDIAVPADKRIARGWDAFAIGPAGSGASALLAWDNLDAAQLPDPVRLRVAVGLDEREEKLVAAYLPTSGNVIGTFDIRYAHTFQPFEIEISRQNAAKIGHEGLGLRLIKGDAPLWLHYALDGGSGPCAALMPHLLVSDPKPDPAQEMANRLASLASLQFFGWQEGCVLNGLLDLQGRLLAESEVRATIAAHIRHFFDANGRLAYEDDFSRPADGRIYGIECTLPFAIIAQMQPDPPALREAVAFWRGQQSTSGAIQDADMLSAEGSYTVAYPMAVLAKALNMPDLRDIAITQLRVRRDRLFVDGAFYLRTYTDGRKTFRNWCRGVAWYMLGLVRTLAELPDPPADLVREVSRVAAWIVSHQLPDGLWATFVDEPDIASDTSGSAGIGAALAIGVRRGFLPDSYLRSAQHAREGLIARLTPDGFLTGVSQVNKAGEPLQRGRYRVISQMGMGLFAQLIAAVD